MVVEHFRQFVIAAIVLSILAFFLLGEQDLLAAANSGLEPGMAGDKLAVVSYGVAGHQERLGGDFLYKIDINAALRLKPQKIDTAIVPVVTYKNVQVRAKIRNNAGNYADTFTIPAGEEASSQNIRAEVLSPTPLLQRIDGRGTYTFTDGVPYVFEDIPNSGSNFKLIASVAPAIVRDSSGDPQQVCAVQFLVECAASLRLTAVLTKCASQTGPDQYCRDVLELCGAKMTFIVSDVDCGTGKATADYETQCTACTKWDVNETAVINFFRVEPDLPQESCVYTKSDDLEQACFADRLGGATLLFDPGAIIPR